MINLIRVEWKKLLGNRMLASFTVWLYPVGLVAFILVMALIHLLGGETYQELSGNWHEPMLSTWQLVTRFPNSSFGRLPLLAFMAVMCAGEYEWSTWKNLVPRNRRYAILLAKIITLALVLVVAVGLTSFISGPFRFAVANLIGIDTAPALLLKEAGRFIGEYALEAGIAFFQSIFLACFALFAALITRTIVGSLLLSFGLSLFEMLSMFILVIFGRFVERPGLVNAYAYFPSYLFDNLRAWILSGSYWDTGMPEFTSNLTLPVTIFRLVIVLGLVVGLCMAIFQRQDITA